MGLRRVGVLFASALALAALLAPTPVSAAVSPAAVTRVAGATRYATAAAAAVAAFPSGANSVVVASGDAFPDALAASYPAGGLNGPLLLVPRDGNATDAVDAVRRLNATEVLVVGGVAAVSENVRQQLASTGASIRSISGSDRFATAAEVAVSTGFAAGVLDEAPTAFVVTGENFPDALSASTVSFAQRFPVLLTRRASLPVRTEEALQALGIRRAIVLGGDLAVSSAVVTRLVQLGVTVERVAGVDRNQTAAAVARFATARLGWAAESIAIANGRNFADGIAAGALAGSRRAPIHLAFDNDDLGSAARDWIAGHCPSVHTVLGVGGNAVLTDRVLQEAAQAVRDCAQQPTPNDTPPPAGNQPTQPTNNGGQGQFTGSDPNATTTTTTTTTTPGATTTLPTVTAVPTTSTTTPPPAACTADSIPAAQAPPSETSALPQVPEPEAPLLHRETARGTQRRADAGVREVTKKSVDGQITDWKGPATGFAGGLRFACGELIYTDFVFDAYGADDGGDAARLQVLDPLNQGVPETYRVDPIFQVDAPGELGVPTPAQAKAEEQYGDANGLQAAADLLEFRLSADASNLFILARTTTMNSGTNPAVLILLDTVPDAATRTVTFASGLTTKAEIAVLLTRAGSLADDLRTAAPAVALPTSAGVNDSGDDYVNAIEGAIPRSFIGSATTLGVAAGTGLANGVGDALQPLVTGKGQLANVAFRAMGDPSTFSVGRPPPTATAAPTSEPVRTWFDKLQALELGKNSIDKFLLPVDLNKLLSGATEAWSPGPGYHERIFLSSPTISSESGQEGIHQHYGVYLPSTYRHGTPAGAGIWLHWRGGKAHSAATVSPRIIRDQGESIRKIVIAPRGRGTDSWYLGKGHADFLEVWDDAFANFSVDSDRVHVSGHSMGGWGSYLMSILYPDRFAAAFPVAGPVTQGAWTGLVPPDRPEGLPTLPPDDDPLPFFDSKFCEDAHFRQGNNPDDSNDYSFCYISTDGGDARIQHTRPLLKNLRNVPIAIFQGAIDELVPTSGVTRQIEELITLGYRHRYYFFPTYEHYSHPIIDEWAEGARYVTGTVAPGVGSPLLRDKRVLNPARVVYRRDMLFECAVENGPRLAHRPSQTGGTVRYECRTPSTRIAGPSLPRDNQVFEFNFNRAYWMSELEPDNLVDGIADFDARSNAITEPFTPGPNPAQPAAGPEPATLPEVGGPASLNQAGPYSMTGLAWAPGTPAVAGPNSFAAKVDGAKHVRLDTVRMGLKTNIGITGALTNADEYQLRLGGPWTSRPKVTIAGADKCPTIEEGALRIDVPALGGALVIDPTQLAVCSS